MSKKSFWAVLAVAAAALALVPSSLPATDSGAATGSVDGGATDLALTYVSGNPDVLGVGSADVVDLFATSTVKSSHSGVTHVNLNQRYQGLEVFGAHSTVSVTVNGRVAFAAGSFVRDLAVGASGAQKLDAAAAVAAAADGLDLAEPEGLRVLESEEGAAQETLLSGAGISDVPIPARLGWKSTASGLRLAWQLSIDDAAGVSHWNATVDAESGALLDVDDWTSHDNLDDLASTLSRSGGSTSAPTVFSTPGTTSPVIDGSSYRVLEIPKESPNDGPFTVVQNPADSFASPFGWHDDNGAAGAEYTITRGNNAHAYQDQDDDEAMDFGTSPDGTNSLDFLFTADLTEHAQAYRDAATTNLFYWNNVFHDITTRYGFDEAADNFQTINYSGVGSNGDYVRAEAADGSGTNNANFNTPSAGGSPRMQMYLWPGNQFGPQNQVVVDGLGSFGAAWARYGPPATNAGVSGQLVLVNDGTALPTEGCSPLVGFPAGAIAVVDRGTCTFQVKTQNAQSAGASAVILANNTTGGAPVLSGTFVAAGPTIPTVSVTQADGATIKAGLPATGTVKKNPAHSGIRDGDLENGIIMHEYGHGVSNRLTGGPGINCLSGNEQMGEGWSDYLAITVAMDLALDDPDLPRGMGPYALFQPDRHGNGIRPRPYTRDMAIQPFTYDSIKSNGWLNGTSLALPHGLGHGWASTLWDLNWDLIDKHGFNPNIYEAWNAGGNNRALQYVMDGMKMQGCGPGLVVGSRAIIAAADTLTSGEDTCTVWATFARRGLGYSAVQGTTNRNDNDEAFDTHPNCQEDFTAGADAAYGTLNANRAGSVVTLKFRADDFDTAEEVVAKSGAPSSRKVDCSTLRVVSVDPNFITPRERLFPTKAQGQTKLAHLGGGQFRYRWQTEADWVGTCREFVLTRADGVQHRAFFRFT
jgi:extracellular elastinolytic metalloproteinase